MLGHLEQPQASARAWFITGLIIGLALLTKFQAYILPPMLAAVWLWQVWHRRQQGEKGRAPWLTGVAAFIPALALPLAWWLRNISLYGLTDPLGLRWHDAVVVGQPRTVEWIASQGWSAYLDRYVEFTFKSFWGVFGWLGVFMDERIYTGLALLTVFVAVGLAWQGWRLWRGQVSLTGFQRRGLALLTFQLLLVLFTYLWYNFTYVQHQGRYLFPALVPISIGFALGMEGLFSSGGSRWGAVVGFVITVALVFSGVRAGDVNVWAVLLAGGATVLLGTAGDFWSGDCSRRGRPSVSATVLALAMLVILAAIALQALFGAIVPQLG